MERESNLQSTVIYEIINSTDEQVKAALKAWRER